MLDEDVKKNVIDILDSKRLFRYDCSKPDESPVAQIENAFANKIGVKYAVAMNSCSSGLYTALLCLGVKPGDKVAIPSFTFIAVPSAIIHAGAQPVLIEMDENYVMDLGDFENKVLKNNIRYLMLSYMRGRVPDLDVVVAMCKKYKVKLIEDAAHSLGTFWKDQSLGTFGQVAAFSTQSYKMIDSGEGGFLVTNDSEIALKAIFYSGCYEKNWRKHYGTKTFNDILEDMTNTLPAFNFRMSNLSSAVLLPQIEKVDKRTEFLLKIYTSFCKILSTCPEIRIPEFTPGYEPAPDTIQWEYINMSDDEINAVSRELLKSNIKVDVFTGGNARCFWNWKFFIQNERCDFTKKLIKRTADMRLTEINNSQDAEKTANIIIETINNIKAKLGS